MFEDVTHRRSRWRVFWPEVDDVVAALSGVNIVPGLVGSAVLALGFVAVVANGALPGVVDVLTFVALLNGVRGTFAYARLSALPTRSEE